MDLFGLGLIINFHQSEGFVYPEVLNCKLSG